MDSYRYRAVGIWACLALFGTPAALVAQTYRFEAESGTFGGASIQTSTSGFSGTGYVTFANDNTTSYVQVGADVPYWFIRDVGRL